MSHPLTAHFGLILRFFAADSEDLRLRVGATRSLELELCTSKELDDATREFCSVEEKSCTMNESEDGSDSVLLKSLPCSRCVTFSISDPNSSSVLLRRDDARDGDIRFNIVATEKRWGCWASRASRFVDAVAAVMVGTAISSLFPSEESLLNSELTSDVCPFVFMAFYCLPC